MPKTLSGRLRERGNERSGSSQPSIHTSPALLRSSPARRERQNEERIDWTSMAGDSRVVNMPEWFKMLGLNSPAEPRLKFFAIL